MALNTSLQRYRWWYATLLRFYPKSYYERFGEGMEQTFSDLCREHQASQPGLLGFVTWIFLETFVGIVKENTSSFIMQNKDILVVFLGATSLLLVPIIGMQTSDGWVWGLSDFIFAWVVFMITGLASAFLARQKGNLFYRAGVGLAVFAAFLLFWVNAAVGLIGDGETSANLLYFGVLGTEILGIIMAKFDPRGMANALYATALMQIAVPVIAYGVWGSALNEPMFTLVAGNAFFVMLFVGSALLFQRAAMQPAR